MQTVRLGVGLFFLLTAALTLRLGGRGGIGGSFIVVGFSAALALVAGMFLYPYIAAPVMKMFGAVYFPGTRGVVREEFSRVQALIAQQADAEAEAELRRILQERPALLEARILLVGLLYDKLGRPAEALEMAQAILAGDGWAEDMERVVALAVDILLEAGRREEAVALLRRSAQRAGRTGAAARLTERLQHLC